MSKENAQQTAEITPAPSAAEKAVPIEQYKNRGYQQLSWKEYQALQEKKQARKGLKIPIHLKLILGTPFLILFCYGIFFIPWMLYLIATSPSAPAPADENPKTYSAAKR